MDFNNIKGKGDRAAQGCGDISESRRVWQRQNLPEALPPSKLPTTVKNKPKMPSRKRNKGKERRAKKEAKAARQIPWWRDWAIGDSESDGGCSHGCVALPPRDHAAAKKHPEAWNDAEYRQMTIDILLSVGTNTILHGTRPDNKYQTARGIGEAALLLECYDSDFVGAHSVAIMKEHLSLPRGCGERDVLKFFSKRLPCSCLKEKHKEARKTLSKFGQCMHCQQEKERSALMTCGRCKVPLYCSRECQVANVPAHKKACGIFVNIRNHQEAKPTVTRSNC